ncbi:unnamed protein product [Trichobilharzia szidati]|nr:unnamed protein product [Trichobilharzia szidati]
MILERLVSIAETWGGVENGFGLAECCDPKHFPETAGNVYFEYRPDHGGRSSAHQNPDDQSTSSNTLGTIVLQALHRRNQSPSEIMEELLAQHPVPASRQMALFSRVRLATYFSEPTQRHKCIRARLQALSILSYTFEVDERYLYPSLLDELVEVLGLPDGQYMGIKACALRTLTAIVNSHRWGINWGSLVGSTGLSSYHGILPNLTRKWVQGLVDGSIKAPAGSTNQHFTTALLSFLYHLACYEENVGPGNTQNAPLSSSGVLDTMMQLISWHSPHNDYLSYVTRAVRVTDQILMSISSSRQHVVGILVDRLSYEVGVVLQGASTSADKSDHSDGEQPLNTQRSGLMKSILNLLKRLCLDSEWGEVLHSVMDDNLPNVLRQIFLNGSSHFTPHLSLFAMETITNYLYTYPSRISAMQDKNITTDILKALTEQPLPQNRDFLVQLPALLNTLALNSRGIEAILSSGVIGRYLNTLVSPEYLSTMKTKRVRDFMSQIPYDMHCSMGQNLSNSLTASQMSNAVHELLRSHAELKPVVSKYAISCLRHVVNLGKTPATLISESMSCGGPSHLSLVSDSTRSADGSCWPMSTADASEPQHSEQRSSASTSQPPSTDAPLSLSSIQRSLAAAEDDAVMLSGGEDDDDDYNSDSDVNQDRQTNTRSATVQAGSIASDSVIPMVSLETSVDCRRVSVTEDTSNKSRTECLPVSPNMFLSDYMLNMCKFLEKPLVFVSHTTQTMCPQFVSQGGLQVLCDLLRMPGLPYDFPVSATCASLCKIFEDLANSVDLNEVTKPLFQCLESSMEKLCSLHTSNYPMTSILLREYLSGEHEMLHELVILASVICILVQMIQHIKPVFHTSLASVWLQQNCLYTLGHLYLGVSWEAAIILKVLFGDKDINESDLLPSETKTSQMYKPQQHPNPSMLNKPPIEPMPRFVEALHMYSLIKQSVLPTTDYQSTFIYKHPELFTALGRFFSNRPQVNYRRRRTSLFSNDSIHPEMRLPALIQVADILSHAYTWEPASTSRSHKAAASLNYAIRYASIQLTNLLLHDSSQRDSDLGMINAFYKLNGINLYFGLFRQLISFDLDDPSIRKPLSMVLEEWLVCADHMSSTKFCAGFNSEASRANDIDANNVNVSKITTRVHQCMLPALAQLCSRTDLQDLLSRKAVEHLLSMLVTVVPCIFNNEKVAMDTDSPSTSAVRPSDSNNTDSGNQPLASVLEDEMSSTAQPIQSSQTTDSEANVPPNTEQRNELPMDVSDTSLEQSPASTTTGLTANPLIVPRTVLQRPDQSQAAIQMTVASSVESSVDNNPSQVMDSQESYLADGDSNNIDGVEEGVRDPDALRLMEEMGFDYDLAMVALEQTGWNTNDAVNLMIATPPEDLMRNAIPPIAAGLRRVRPPRRSQRHRIGGGGTAGEVGVGSQSTSSETSMDTTGIQSNVYEHLTEFIDNLSTIDRLETLMNTDDPTITGSEVTLPTNSSLNLKDLKRPSAYKFPLVMLEPFNEKVYNEARESLKQNVFKTCYAIAKRHHSDQILHQIAELFLSSGEHERYINELFAVVISSLASYLRIPPTTTTVNSKPSDVLLLSPENPEFVNRDTEHQTVGLHLLVLLFTRCPSVCASLAWSYKLPSMLIEFICQSEVISKPIVDGSDNAGVGSSHGHSMCVEMNDAELGSSQGVSSVSSSKTDYYKTLTLAFLILDQYEKSIQAMRLRQESIKLYASSHNWYWFDNQAVLWHPYANESMRVIDKRFHRGDLFASYDVNRRPYTVEFPTMTQRNLVSMHRRPVLLFPSIPKDGETNTETSTTDQMSPYELSLMNTEVPECLNPVERSKLCQALIQHFRALKRTPSAATTQSNASLSSSSFTETNMPTSSDQQTPLPSDCLNAMFRLLLRLCFTSYENARELAESDFLTVLFTYPHAKEFSADYSAFVGALISEVFDDSATSERIMKEILSKMSKYGIPSAFMGIEAGPRSCRDLFYLLNMCSPLFAKDRQRAMKLMSETFSLSIPKTDLETKSYPKTYTVEEAGPNSERSTLFPLTSRQKHLLTQLMDLIMSSTVLKSKGDCRSSSTTTGVGTYLEKISSNCYIYSTSVYFQDTNARGDDSFTSMTAPLDPTLINTLSPASSTTTVNWGSSSTTTTTTTTTTGQSSSSTYGRQHPGLTINTTTANPQQSSMPCSDVNKQQKTGLIVLGKLDALRYLIDLVGTYKSVAEFIAMYKHKHAEHHHHHTVAGKSTTTDTSLLSSPSFSSSPKCSFLSYLFSYQLTDPATTEVTMSLLENLIIISSESVQRLIINEFKASLSRIGVKSLPSSSSSCDDIKSDSVSSMKNDRISSHMMFLIRLLSLPKPLVMPILRLLYKRRISADIGKLIAIIGCNLSNTQSTISYMLRALENFTLVYREYTKLYSQSSSSSKQQQQSGVGNNSVVVGRQVINPASTTTSSAAAADNDHSGPVPSNSAAVQLMMTGIHDDDNVQHSVVIHGSPTTNPRRIEASSISGVRDSEIQSVPGNNNTSRDFETDSDDDDEEDDEDQEDNDITMLVDHQEEFSHPVENVETAFSGGSVVVGGGGAGGASSSTGSNLSRVLSDVLAADMVVIATDHHHGENNVRQPWHRVSNSSDPEARSVIFVYDDEDEGSSGQGAEGNNSQDDEEEEEDDEEDDVLEAEEGDEEEDDDDEHVDEEEEEDEDGEDDDDPEVEGDDGDDVDVSGEDDEEVAFVLSRNRRPNTNRVRPSGMSSPHRRRRRHRIDPATISLTVTTSRSNNDRNNQNPESHHNNDDDGDMHDETGNIVLHDDTHVVDARSYEGVDIDDYSEAIQDTIRDDIAIILPEVRGSRGSHSVSTVMEQALRRVVGPTLSALATNGLRDIGTTSLSTISQSRGGNSGNWDLLFPSFTNFIAGGDGPRRSAVDSGNSTLSGAAVFRINPDVSVYVPGNNAGGRFGSSGGNVVSSANNQLSQSPQILPTATIANQHPLLQVPTAASASAAPSTHSVNVGVSSRNAGSNGLRLTGRPIVTNTMSTSNRVVAHLPPIPQQHVPPHYGTRHRIAGPHPSSSSNGGWRYHTVINRLYGTESDVDHAISSGGSNSHSRNPVTSDARDNRSGPEANELVWSMLTSLAEDQPSPANSALAAAVFSRFLSPLNRIQQGVMDVSSRGINHAQLIPYAGYALPPHYRRWINLCRMLFGHEIMDIILLSRHHIYKVLEERRHEVFKLRIAESEVANKSPVVTSSPCEPTVAAPALASSISQPTTESTETSVTFTNPVVTNVVVTLGNSDNTGDSPTERTTTAQVPLTPDVVSPVETLEISSNSEVPSTADQHLEESSNTATTTTAGQSETQPATSTAENISNLVVSNIAPTRPPVMMTDEETIQSLVEGGMDPSFLDALPEEMRQEVIADHRYARQVQQQINSMSLPEHINSEWLTGLPPHIQEEVLAQFRQEQQQQRQSSAQPTTQSTNANPSEQPTQPATSQSNTDSNTAFLASLPPSVLREVLADMEESQFETLPQHLVTEANRLRREHEERYARAVQNGLLSHSTDTRPDHIWRNFTTASGLIGGHGRWDVRFNSINQFLRHLDSVGVSLGSNNSLAGRSAAGICGRELVDHEGLTCIIVVLISMSTCSYHKKHIVPTIKRVLRNLACHTNTRNWIVNTLISLFNGLCEKPLSSHSRLTHSTDNYEMITSSSGMNQSSSLITTKEGEFDYSYKSGSNAKNNTLFNAGFEAALGCWVRIFHPISQNPTVSSSSQSQNETHTAVGSSNSTNPVRYIIHPQAAVSVAGVLLETLNELTQSFPSHFYPAEASQISETTSDVKSLPLSSSSSSSRVGTSQNTDIPTTSFWDIFSRLSQSNTTSPTNSTTGSTPTRPSIRRTRISSRKRPLSISDKQSNDSPQEPTSSSVKISVNPYHSSSQLTAMETSFTTENTESESVKEAHDAAKQNASKSTPNCFIALSELLCHQMLHDRPVNQERLVIILAGIVKDFLLSRSHSDISVARASTHPNNLITPTTTVNTLTDSSNQQDPTDNPVDQPTTSSSVTNTSPATPVPETQSSVVSTHSTTSTIASPPNDLMDPLRPHVIEAICQLVLAPKFTESARAITSQLLTDLAQSNHLMKETILRLLCNTAGQLISKISIQLQSLILEVDNRLKDELPLQSTSKQYQSRPSTSRYPPDISRISSYDILPDRFGSPGQMVVVSGEARQQAAAKFTDLQLTSSEPFTYPNNDQCRLRGVLGLMLRIAAGDSSLVGTNLISVSSNDLLSTVPGVNEFWNYLCQAFERLQALNDQNAVLLLQPLLEVFCLAHVHLLKDTILLRQRPTNNRSNRSNSCSTGASSFIDMVPLLHICVDSSSQSEFDSNRSSTTDHLGHLYFDLGGPLSPSGTTGEDEELTIEGSTTSCTLTSQNSQSRNPIIQFADKYRRGLSQVLRQYGANIGESPFAVFLAYPRVLDFDVKRRFFRQQLQSLSNRSSSSSRLDDEPITVSRERIFEDSYARLHRKSVNEWKHKFVIRFQNEEGQDAGGPLREWFLLMSREIFNPNYCLFRVSPADRVTYTINPSSYINSNHLSYFKFVGRFIAKAINDNKLLECYFTRAFYKHILGVPVKCSDLESEDYEFFKGLEFLLSHNVSDLGYELTFSTEINEFGKTDTRDLIENGRNVPVTESNKKEYVRLVCQERMTGAIRQQLDAFLSGFYDIIPKRMISIFNEQELELLISGLPNIDISDLKANTVYSKYQPNSPQIEWFWQALESFDQEDLARFLQFVTGTSKVPLGGFTNLEGMHGATKFQISRAAISSTSHLPSAHTCFNTLVLPAYESYEQLRSRLLMAIRECSEGYGMA